MAKKKKGKKGRGEDPYADWESELGQDGAPGADAGERGARAANIVAPEVGGSFVRDLVALARWRGRPAVGARGRACGPQQHDGERAWRMADTAGGHHRLPWLSAQKSALTFLPCGLTTVEGGELPAALPTSYFKHASLTTTKRSFSREEVIQGL